MAEDDTGTGEEEGSKEPAQMTTAETKASKSGWRPEEDWKGDPDDWIPAKEFNYRGELMGRISEQSSILNNFKNQIEELKVTNSDLVDHHRNMSEREYKKALKTLKAAKVDAIDEGDGASVVEIDTEIDELKDKRDAANTTAGGQDKNIKDTTPPEVIDWLQQPQNKWYATDSFMKNVADAIAKELYQKSPNLPPATLLKQMDDRMRKELPHKFEGNPSVNQLDADDTNNSSANRPKGKKLGMKDLNEDQQAVARRFIKSGLMTLSEYIDDLKTVGDI